MYEEFYGLRERPFNLTPDPDYLYLSPQHKLAKSYLEYGLEQHLGFVVLTGGIGTGKTTLIKSLLQVTQRNQRVGVLYQTSFDGTDLLDQVLHEFGIRGNFHTRTARLAALNQFFQSAQNRGEHLVLIVDEAQNLSPEALEELRLLSNLQAQKQPLLQVILVGQPGLGDRLRHPALGQLAQRVAVHYHLRPLTLEETKEYIRFRLARAGGSNIFTEEALARIYEYTQGVPRRINIWCDLALVAGFAEGRREIDQDFVGMVYEAQGGGMEGVGDLEAAEAETPPLGLQAPSSNNLEARIGALASRVARLEGLVLEMTGQLMPLLSQLAGKAAPPTLESPGAASGEAGLEAGTAGEFTSPHPGWWSRITGMTQRLKFWSRKA
jgi:general secretion pathway protein A